MFGIWPIFGTVALACLLVWAYEVVAYAWPFRFHVGSVRLDRVLVESIPVKTVGATLVSAAILLYGDAYGDYCGRVGRYFSWHRSARNTKRRPTGKGT